MILDGKELAQKIRLELKKEVDNMPEKPILAVMLVGDNSASKVYVNMKEIACQDIGIISRKIHLSGDVLEEELLNTVRELNNSEVNAILVQLPLPKHIDENKVIKAIKPEKDVDGFHPVNIAKLYLNEKGLLPCTPKGIMRILDEYNIDIEGKNVVVVGRSNIVGKPIAIMLLHRNATVTICHSRTKNLEEHTKKADILVVAVGKENLISKEMVKDGAVIIDVGMNRGEKEGKKYLCGDVDFQNLKDITCITPVPKGVGPMTVAMLMVNVVEAFKMQKNLNSKN